MRLIMICIVIYSIIQWYDNTENVHSSASRVAGSFDLFSDVIRMNINA